MNEIDGLGNWWANKRQQQTKLNVQKRGSEKILFFWAILTPSIDWVIIGRSICLTFVFFSVCNSHNWFDLKFFSAEWFFSGWKILSWNDYRLSIWKIAILAELIWKKIQKNFLSIWIQPANCYSIHIVTWTYRCLWTIYSNVRCLDFLTESLFVSISFFRISKLKKNQK